MAGISSFFESESVSDVRLTLLVSRPSSLQGAIYHSSIVDAITSSNTEKPNLAETILLKASKPDDDEVLSIPAHKLILMAKSTYLNTRLSTAVGDRCTHVIKEHAGSLEEANAMHAVVKFMYTEQLPLVCSQGLVPGMKGGLQDLSVVQWLVSMLTVADRWQVPACVTACCSAICTQIMAGMTWSDCFSLQNLSVGLREQQCMSQVMELATTHTVTLSKGVAATSLEAQQQFLSAQLHKLPVDVRLKLFKGCKLGFAGAMALVSSNEQIADSEDSLAILLSCYKAQHGFTAAQLIELKEQLRYQHMSHTFVGLKVPMIPALCLSMSQASQLMYIRGVHGVASIPAQHRLPTVPAAWYAPMRTSNLPLPDRVELQLSIAESAMLAYLQGITLAVDSGSPAPVDIQGSTVIFKGTAWHLVLSCIPADKQLRVSVCPTFNQPGLYDTVTSRTAGIYADITCHLDSASPVISDRKASWVGEQGLCFHSFAQDDYEVSADTVKLECWRDHMMGGCVVFSATVCIT